MLSRLEISAFDRHPRNATTVPALVELLRARKGMPLHRARKRKKSSAASALANSRGAEIVGPHLATHPVGDDGELERVAIKN